METAIYDFEIKQGATFTRTLTLKDDAGNIIDLTGYAARLQAREKPESTSIIFELTIANGGIVLTPAIGQIVWTRTAAETAAMSFNMAVYDFEIESPAGNVMRLLEGEVTLSHEVTR